MFVLPLSSVPSAASYVSQQESSYDIDNIIPYGMMSCTRLVERLKYKEILTPKWRLVHIPVVEPSTADSKTPPCDASGLDNNANSTVANVQDGASAAEGNKVSRLGFVFFFYIYIYIC